MVITFSLYLICFLIIISALQVIFAKNPIHSVILLVLVFLQTAILFLLLGAEFLAILLVTVYIGAIAILFLFVVMLLNVRVVEIYSSLQYHIPIGALAGLCFIMLLMLICLQEFKTFMFTLWCVEQQHLNSQLSLWPELVFFQTNLHSIGEVFYNYYLDIFVIITLLLLVAMIGVILLAVDYEYRQVSGEKELIFPMYLRSSKRNIVWLNMEIYGKKRSAFPSNTWSKLFKQLNIN